MKIMVSNSVLPHGAFHEWIGPDLEKLGHDVTTIDLDELQEAYGVDLARRVLIQRVAAERPELLLVHPPYDVLTHEDADDIRRFGCRVVAFAYDDAIFLPAYKVGGLLKVLRKIKATYDLYCTTSREMVDGAARCGFHNLRYLRWACRTPDPLPDPAPVRDLDVVLVGGAYPRRVDMVRALRAAGVRVALYGGESWKHYPDIADLYVGFLSKEGMADVYSRAKIALAPADWEHVYVPMVKLRLLEAVRYGCCVLHEDCPEIRDYFDSWEVVTFEANNLQDLVQAAQVMLTPPWPTAATGEAARVRLNAEHLWTTRWPELEAMLPPATGTGDKRVDFPTRHFDPSLVRELSLAACADHYERGGDLGTAVGAYKELASLQVRWKDGGDQNRSFTALVGQARCAFMSDDYKRADELFRRAATLAPTGLINLTVSQKKLGHRLGLGRLFAGLFPQTLECYAHRLIIYALTGQTSDAERLLKQLAWNPDQLFATLVAILKDNNIQQRIGMQALARYAAAALDCQPLMWAGERRRHAAAFRLMVGRARVAMGQYSEARAELGKGLDADPAPLVKTAILTKLQEIDAVTRTADLLISPEEPDNESTSTWGRKP